MTDYQHPIYKYINKTTLPKTHADGTPTLRHEREQKLHDIYNGKEFNDFLSERFELYAQAKMDALSRTGQNRLEYDMWQIRNAIALSAEYILNPHESSRRKSDTLTEDTSRKRAKKDGLTDFSGHSDVPAPDKFAELDFYAELEDKFDGIELDVAIMLSRGYSKTQVERATGLSRSQIRTIVEHIRRDYHKKPKVAEVGRKSCTKCGIEKGFAEFGNDKRKSDGKQPICKACDRERKREKLAGNPLKIA